MKHEMDRDAAGDVTLQVSRLIELGDAWCDADSSDRATHAYGLALRLLPSSMAASDRIADVHAVDRTERASALCDEAEGMEASAAAERFVRASRLLAGVDEAGREAIAVRAFHLAPSNANVLAALENLFVASRRTEALYALIDHALATADSHAERAEMLEVFVVRCVARLGDLDRANVLLDRFAPTRPGENETRRASETMSESDDGTGGSAPPSNSDGGDGGDGRARRKAPDPAQIAALEEQAAKFEGQKRWADVVKVLAQKAELLSEDSERIETFERIAKVHTEKTNNVAEAIKAYEAVHEIDPDHAAAIEFLKSRYEQRRDWEKLLGILRREAQRASDHAQLDAYLSMAKLAA
ncbi:MAG: tetratricopeptide repeat protein, partial [Thermoanaerobaculia bacterium]